MAFGDNAIDFVEAKLDTAIGRAEQMHPTKAQFTLQGRTSRHLRFKKMPIKGKLHYYRMLTQPMSAVRVEKYPTAITEEFPIGRDFAYTEYALSHDLLSMFKATGKWNLQRELKGQTDNLSVAKLAVQIMSFMGQNFSDRVNTQMFTSSNCAMGTVAQIYDADGSTFTGASGHASAYIAINGPISRFQRGMVLDIYNSDGTTWKNRVVVQGVIYGDDGPPDGSGGVVASIGPGIICEPCDAAGAVESTAWNAVEAPDNAGDYLALSGEFSTTTPKGFPGIPDFFDRTIDCHYHASAGTLTAVDREAVGYEYLNPMVITPSGASAGSEVTFSMEDHFAQLEDTMPYFVDFGRANRNIGDGLEGPEEKIVVGSAMTFVTPIEIANYVARTYAGDTLRFSATAASSLSEAKRKELFGHVGFEGIVFHSASLPPIGFMGDPNCTPYRGYLLEPQSFQMLVFGTAPGDGEQVNIDYLKHAGSRLWPVYGDTNKTGTFYVQVHGFTSCGLTNDQPMASVAFNHIKSDRQ